MEERLRERKQFKCEKVKEAEGKRRKRKRERQSERKDRVRR